MREKNIVKNKLEGNLGNQILERPNWPVVNFTAMRTVREQLKDEVNCWFHYRSKWTGYEHATLFQWGFHDEASETFVFLSLLCLFDTE